MEVGRGRECNFVQFRPLDCRRGHRVAVLLEACDDDDYQSPVWGVSGEGGWEVVINDVLH